MYVCVDLCVYVYCVYQYNMHTLYSIVPKQFSLLMIGNKYY